MLFEGGEEGVKWKGNGGISSCSVSVVIFDEVLKSR